MCTEPINKSLEPQTESRLAVEQEPMRFGRCLSHSVRLLHLAASDSPALANEVLNPGDDLLVRDVGEVGVVIEPLLDESVSQLTLRRGSG